MKLTLKQFVVRILLAALRGLMLAKRHGGPVLHSVGGQVAAIGHAFVRALGVPAYRFLFLVKRHGSRVILPAKNRVLYVVSNRYTIHAAMAAVALATVVAGVSGPQVRTETFGTGSLLYRLLAEDDQALEVVAATQERLAVAKAVSYMERPLVDPDAHIDLNYLGEDYVTPVVGGTAVAQQPLTDAGEPVQQREEVVRYPVEEGDTLSGIATKHGLSLSTVLWANDMTVRSTIRPGQELVILPVDGVRHTVKSGETVLKVAEEFGADAERIVRFNKLASADDLHAGETILIPGGEKPTPSVQRTAPVSSLFTKPVPRSAPESRESRGSSTGSGDWVWPTDWRVITQYYGWRHTGLDIDGDYSTHSYASADGVVIYTGWRSGYGLTVEIDHGNGITTRYAHHSKNFVKVGDVVTVGQIIAQTGTTGRSTGTHLHFEVIKNGSFQNPLDWIR